MKNQTNLDKFVEIGCVPVFSHILDMGGDFLFIAQDPESDGEGFLVEIQNTSSEDKSCVMELNDLEELAENLLTFVKVLKAKAE